MTQAAFGREALDALFNELRREWRGKHQLDGLIRDAHLAIAHLAIALHDAGRPLGDDIDPWVASLIQRHSPAG